MINFYILSVLSITFKEDFSNGLNEWVSSNWNSDKMGEWQVADTGLKTMKDASFYAISKKMSPSFSSQNDFFVQYRVKNPQNIDCGGSYLKLFPSNVDQNTLKGGEEEDKYYIMFGPDFCGTTKKTHLIFHHAGKNYENNKNLNAIHDTNTHLYTFALYKNGSYAFWIDSSLSMNGELREDYNFLLPKKIPDPSIEKPSDWIDDPMMKDPNDSKPEGWDDIPSEIVDPDATKPDDWDDEDDGEWEPPLISNPEYKGEWSAKMISNPHYKGAWVHPMIDNPEYKDDLSIAVYDDISIVAFELWQVKSGTLFDNIVVTDQFDEIITGFHEFEQFNKEEQKIEQSVENTENTEKEEL